jgi:hypothetical protein
MGEYERRIHNRLAAHPGKVSIDAAAIAAEADAELNALRTLAEHLRHCRECGETDVANCAEGEALWDACMPQPAAEVGAA